MSLLPRIGELLIAGVHLTSKINFRQCLRYVIRQLRESARFLAVRAGAFTICRFPVRHTILAEHSLTVCALLGFADDLGAHHTREMLVNLSHNLLFGKLWKAR